MANIPIRDIPGAVVASPDPSNLIPMDNGSIMQKTTIANAVNTTLPLSSQAEAEAGVDNVKRMSSLRTKQAIDAQTPAIVNAAITALNLGTMSQEESSDYTPTSGLAAVALSNDYNDLDNLPTLGTAAATDASDYATAAQGSLASSAIQPGDAQLVPSGGTIGQVLLKNSGTNYDTSWATVSAATAVSYTAGQGLTPTQQSDARDNISALGPNETADKAFRRGNILGTVSQTGGVPTGQLVEVGSNADWFWERHASGRLEIWSKADFGVSAVASAVSTTNLTWPVAFVAAPATFISIRSTSVTNSYSFTTPPMLTGSNTTGTLTFNASSTQQYRFSLYIVGRWF